MNIGMNNAMSNQPKKEIYTYEASSHLYAFNWAERRPSYIGNNSNNMYQQGSSNSNNPIGFNTNAFDTESSSSSSMSSSFSSAPGGAPGSSFSSDFRIAVSTFVEEYTNKIEIIQYDPLQDAFVQRGVMDHPYPATKIKWIPDPNAQYEDLLATTGDYLRIWRATTEDSMTPTLRSLLKANKDSDVCAPLTSFDWNDHDKNIIGTSSIDTTCTIWDIEKEAVICQLIAHDDEVYDIAFGKGKSEFASVGDDGHIRMFDLRHLEHSTIMFENPVPLLRLAWNKLDPNLIAAVQMDSPNAIIIDIRYPGKALLQLGGHSAPLTSISWAPNSSSYICTSSDDSRALIWDISLASQSPSHTQGSDAIGSNRKPPVSQIDPMLVYHAESEINQLQWSRSNASWIGIAFENKLQVLRV